MYANSFLHRLASGSPRRATPPHAMMTGEMCHHVKAAVEVGGGGHPIFFNVHVVKYLSFVLFKTFFFFYFFLTQSILIFDLVNECCRIFNTIFF